MNNKIKLWLLKKLLKKNAPLSVRMTGVECENNDFYAMYIVGEDKEEKYRLDGINIAQGVLEVKAPDQSKNYTIEKKLKIFDEGLKSHFKVIHYYKNFWKTYENMTFLFFSYITNLGKAEINIRRVWEEISQRLFNSRPLVEKKKRMELLRWLINEDRHKSSVDKNKIYTKVEFNVNQVLNDLNSSYRWIIHPDGRRAQADLRGLMDSLLFSGELTEDGGTYLVSQKAIITLDEYDENERQHAETLRPTKILAWLTGALVVGVFCETSLSVPVIRGAVNSFVKAFF